MSNKFKFEVGAKVNYTVSGKVWFSGTVTKHETDPSKKPYEVTDTNGQVKYAHEKHLVRAEYAGQRKVGKDIERRVKQGLSNQSSEQKRLQRQKLQFYAKLLNKNKNHQ